MKFFSNKISVNGPSRSFNDIIQDVAGGMKKQASAVDKGSKELPDFIKQKIEERESGAPASGKPKKGKVPPQLADFMKKKKKNKKKAQSDLITKIADVIKVNDDEVLLVLAEGGACEADVDIEDDATDKQILEAMGTISNAACGYDAKESESCEACGTSYADSDAEEMTEEAGWSAKAASESPKFVKIANLTDKQKGKFRSYWSNVWPKDFIDAVLDTEN